MLQHARQQLFIIVLRQAITARRSFSISLPQIKRRIQEHKIDRVVSNISKEIDGIHRKNKSVGQRHARVENMRLKCSQSGERVGL